MWCASRAGPAPRRRRLVECNRYEVERQGSAHRSQMFNTAVSMPIATEMLPCMASTGQDNGRGSS